MMMNVGSILCNFVRTNNENDDSDSASLPAVN